MSNKTTRQRIIGLLNIRRNLPIAYCLLSIVISCNKNAHPATAVPDKPAVTDTSADKLSVVLKHTLPIQLQESSGLCYTDGNLWSFGDSGNPNAIYKIDSATGAILQTVTIANYPNIDWESMAADSLYLYIGDMGNNDGNRTDLKILRIKKADLASAPAQVSVQADSITFSYTDQTSFSYNSNTNFDCEAMVAVGNNLYVFTKDRGDLKTRCYMLPKNPGTYAVSPVSGFDVSGRITDAAYNKATGELALLGYMSQKDNSFIWFFSNYPGEHFFADSSLRITIGRSSDEWQTEGLDYVSPTRLLLSCETTPAHTAALYSIQK
ncbi:hypothetical protein A4D02_24480 [Niastella koreensis]|uniref:Uncharacterized protein n=2 Tax=Niastella koreensis TaxID=354356 RepID=G8TEQ4_NIAKG|nr:hypothetical protein [Niastella koreensis]AEW00490.1 hypothetical protein Niako_4218 [Niastella koreensis GR20-10]OQP52351.1 hypothetical protein A4D02_24480 [Niastella koreensis]